MEAESELKKLSRTHPIYFFDDFKAPGSKMIVHMFETRYKIMLTSAMALDMQFIYITSYDTFAASKGQIGLLCTVDDIRHDFHGNMYVNVTCTKRIQVQHTWIEHSNNLHYALWDDFRDTNEPVTVESKNEFTKIYENLVTLFEIVSLTGTINLGPPPPLSELSLAVWWVIEFLLRMRQIHGPSLCTSLLTMTSLQKRIDTI